MVIVWVGFKPNILVANMFGVQVDKKYGVVVKTVKLRWANGYGR